MNNCGVSYLKVNMTFIVHFTNELDFLVKRNKINVLAYHKIFVSNNVLMMKCLNQTAHSNCSEKYDRFLIKRIFSSESFTYLFQQEKQQ